MIKGIFKRSFTKYLSSYILCLILPVLIFSLLYKNYFIADYSQQLIKKATENIDNTYAYIDLQITNFNKISYQLLLSRQLSDIALQDNPPIITFYSVKDLLNNYINTNESIFDIWVFDKQNHRYYSSKQMLDMNSFKKYGPVFPDISYEKFDDLLITSYHPIWIGEKYINIYNQVYPLITYIATYPNSSIASNSVLIFYIENSIFDQPLKSVIQWAQSTSVVIDDKGSIIYSMNNKMKPVVDKIIAEYDIHSNGTMLVDINHQKYFVHIKNSSQNNLKYLSVISYEYLIADAQKFTKIFIFVIMGIILSGSILILFLMKCNYNPIMKLIRYAKKQLNVTFSQNPNVSDIDQIRMTIENIVNKNIFLIQYNKKYVQERILLQLIKGINDINPNEIYQADIDCSGNYNIVVIFRMGKNIVNDIEDFKKIFDRAMSALSYDYNTYFIEYLEQRSFIVIFTREKEDLYFKQKIKTLSQEISKITASDVFAAIGNPCENIKDISHSFIQARTVMRYQMNKNAEKIISFSELHDEETPNYLYLTAELNTLQDSITNRDPAKVEFITYELIDTIKDITTSYFFAMCTCYNIINIFFKGILDIKGSIAEFMKKHQTIFQRKFDYSIDDLINIIISLLHEVTSYIDINVDTGIISYKSILQFIEDNYKKNDFSVQSVAEHFGLSVSNLSHQFKSYTGISISSYISALKINYAKELLSTTNIPVNKIAAELGYFQTSSFIRKFKQTEGITPGEYRNKYIDR